MGFGEGEREAWERGRDLEFAPLKSPWLPLESERRREGEKERERNIESESFFRVWNSLHMGSQENPQVFLLDWA